MAAWVGFSDEELRRIQKKGESNDAVLASFGRGRRSAPTNRSRLQLQREKALQAVEKHKDSCGSPLSPEQQLNPPAPPEPSRPCSGKTPEQEPKQQEREVVEPDLEPPSDDSTAVVKELDRQEVELREKTRLEQLQWEQRLMEEKNKRRKAILAKTIAEKSKQTQAETVKLKKIQKELQALDDSVSSDISILRRLIDQASVEYSTAWKRLEKAEAEYVSAKLDLHKKTEAKERLTEHLCTIIQQNEARKACKLEELMQQLELSAEGEASPESPTPPRCVVEAGSGETEVPPQPAVVNGRLAETDVETPTDSGDVSRDCAMAGPKTRQDREEEFIAPTPSVS